jgi:transmembrane sensor
MFPQKKPAVAEAQHPHRTRGPRAGRLLAGIAGMAAAVVLAWFGVAHWQPGLMSHGRDVAQSYSGDATGVRALTLPDGTLVQLDHGSRIDVHFDEHVRHVAVLQGHVLFDVGKDPARPMLVDVGGHVLQDIGTIFDVRRDADSDTLTVISGRVRVLNALKPFSNGDKLPPVGDAVADLTAGQQIELAVTSAGAVRPVQTAEVTAWLPSEISFQHETIGNVARRFNAYTSKPLVIENDDIAEKHISGIFHAHNPQAFVAYLATLPDVRVIDAGDRIRVVAASHQADAKAGRL